MATVTINIGSGTPCVVKFASLDSTKSDKVEWVNNTTNDVLVFFPHDGVIGRGPFVQQIQAGKKFFRPDPATKKGQSTPERYSYAVFCAETGGFAVGNSDPEIIIM